MVGSTPWHSTYYVLHSRYLHIMQENHMDGLGVGAAAIIGSNGFEGGERGRETGWESVGEREGERGAKIRQSQGTSKKWNEGVKCWHVYAL